MLELEKALALVPPSTPSLEMIKPDGKTFVSVLSLLPNAEVIAERGARA